MAKSPAYSELYLKDARENIAWAFEYGVLGLGFSLEAFVQKWLSFKYIDLIEKGDPHFISGMSGIELSWLVAEIENQDKREKKELLSPQEIGLKNIEFLLIIS